MLSILLVLPILLSTLLAQSAEEIHWSGIPEEPSVWVMNRRPGIRICYASYESNLRYFHKRSEILGLYLGTANLIPIVVERFGDVFKFDSGMKMEEYCWTIKFTLPIVKERHNYVLKLLFRNGTGRELTTFSPRFALVSKKTAHDGYYPFSFHVPKDRQVFIDQHGQRIYPEANPSFKWSHLFPNNPSVHASNGAFKLLHRKPCLKKQRRCPTNYNGKESSMSRSVSWADSKGMKLETDQGYHVDAEVVLSPIDPITRLLFCAFTRCVSDPSTK